MKNHEKKVELLAPAGSEEAFYGAIHGGADAVYLAGDRFGARAYAENFDTETLLKCIHYGHILGRKLYLTVNTLLKEEEMKGLYDYLAPFYEAELDAVIVQDLGVFRFIREHFPDWKIHVSTQMTICSGYGGRLLKEMGACRIVPARELSLEELVAMKRQADIEIETFIHGAMCYSYSGQCLFSSILGGRSGNRGRCAQPCRLGYTAVAGSAKCGECFPLSLKDLCAIEHIPQLIEAGIDSFKIEGRMKKPEYAAGVTAVYRHYIDMYYELRKTMGMEEAAKAYHIRKEDWNILNSLYIRSEIQDGYYFKHNGKEMVTMKSPSYSGCDEGLLMDIRKKYIESKTRLPIDITAVMQPGRPAQITLHLEGIRADVTGGMVELAQKQPVTEDNIRKQLGKLGDSVFCVGKMDISAGENIFYPLSQLNELRRRAVAILERQRLNSYGYGSGKKGRNWEITRQQVAGNLRSGSEAEEAWALLVSTKQQLEAVWVWLSQNEDKTARRKIRIYVEGDILAAQDSGLVAALCQKLSVSYPLYIALPYIIREYDREYLRNLYDQVSKKEIFHGFLARSMDGIGFLRSVQEPYRLDAGIYIWNMAARQEMDSGAEGFCIPYELKASEQRELLRMPGLPCEKLVYSRIPMMITANCILQTMGQCKKGRNDIPYALLRDKLHMEFPVRINCLHCMNIIYNSVPFSLYSEIPKWKEYVDLRMDFTLESPEEVKGLLDLFLGDISMGKKEKAATKGHEKRGVQ